MGCVDLESTGLGLLQGHLDRELVNIEASSK